jgi:hypothetical protein
MTDDRCRVRSGNGCCPPCRLAISSVMDNPPAIRTPRCASVLRPLAPNCATTRPISIRSNRLLLSSMPICAKPRSARYSVAARRQTARPLPPARMRQLLRQLRLCSDLSGFRSSTRASTTSPPGDVYFRYGQTILPEREGANDRLRRLRSFPIRRTILDLQPAFSRAIGRA